MKTNPKEGLRCVAQTHVHWRTRATESANEQIKEAKGSDQNEVGSKSHFI